MFLLVGFKGFCSFLEASSISVKKRKEGGETVSSFFLCPFPFYITLSSQKKDLL